MQTARYFGLPIPISTDADQIKSNSVPTIGGGILFEYSTGAHIAVIRKFLLDGFWIEEGNYWNCHKTYRFVSYNNPFIIGFTKKDSIEVRDKFFTDYYLSKFYTSQ